MNSHYDYHFQKEVVIIHPGEFFVSGDDILIGTVLGSCVSVLLFDSVRHIGGMNHFMLASCPSNARDADATSGRYGDNAFPLLLAEMQRKGADMRKLTAKVFGGGNIISTETDIHHIKVSLENIAYAYDQLEILHIPILAAETGGDRSYKLFYSPVTSKVWLHRIGNPSVI